jgi:hypothetical protein
MDFVPAALLYLPADWPELNPKALLRKAAERTIGDLLCKIGAHR